MSKIKITSTNKDDTVCNAGYNLHCPWYYEVFQKDLSAYWSFSDWSVVRFCDPVWTYTRYTRASASHRCVGTLEAPTSYGNNRLCLRAVGARKLVEILIKGAIPLLPTDKYELHPQCSYPSPTPTHPLPFYRSDKWKWKKRVVLYFLRRDKSVAFQGSRLDYPFEIRHCHIKDIVAG